MSEERKIEESGRQGMIESKNRERQDKKEGKMREIEREKVTMGAAKMEKKENKKWEICKKSQMCMCNIRENV